MFHINICIKYLIQPFQDSAQQYAFDTVLLNTNQILRQFSANDRFKNHLYNSLSIRNVRLITATDIIAATVTASTTTGTATTITTVTTTAATITNGTASYYRYY